MTFEKLFVSLDMLAPPIELSVAGQKAYRTKFGGILTVCLLGFLTTAMFFILKQALRTDIPISYQELATGKDYPTFNLVDSNHIPVLAFYANETETMTTDMFPKYFTADCMQVIWGGSTDAQGNYMMTRDIKMFPVKPCKDLTREQKRYLNYAEANSSFVQLIEDSGICVVPDENFWISGKNSDDVFVELVFRLRPCSLDTGCVSYGEIAKVNFYLGLPTTNIDLTNYENPYSQSLTADDLYYVNPTINQRMRLSLRTVDLWDLSTLFPAWIFKLTFAEISKLFITSTDRRSNNLHCSPELVNSIDDTEACESYLQFNFQSSGTKMKIKRRYKSYTEIFGEIGGVKELLIMGFAFLYVWPNKQSFKRFISQELANMSKGDEKRPLGDDGPLELPKSRKESSDSEGNPIAQQSANTNYVSVVDLSASNPNEQSTANLKELPETKQQPPPAEQKKSFGDSCLDIFKVCIRGTTVNSEDEILADTLDVIWMIRELHKWRILGQLIFTKEQMGKLPRIVAKMQQNPELGFEELEKSPLINNFRREVYNIVESLHARPVLPPDRGVPKNLDMKSKSDQLQVQRESQDKTQIDFEASKLSVSAKDSSKPPDQPELSKSVDLDPGSAIVAKYFANEERIKHVARASSKLPSNKIFSYSPKPPSSRPLQQSTIAAARIVPSRTPAPPPRPA